MAKTLKERDGATATTTLVAETLGHDIQLRVGPSGAGKGGDIYIKESVAANGDITYRWHRFEPPAK